MAFNDNPLPPLPKYHVYFTNCFAEPLKVAKIIKDWRTANIEDMNPKSYRRASRLSGDGEKNLGWTCDVIKPEPRNQTKWPRCKYSEEASQNDGLEDPPPLLPNKLSVRRNCDSASQSSSAGERTLIASKEKRISGAQTGC